MKKIYLVLIVCLTAMAAFAQYNPVFTEDFKNTKNPWKADKKKNLESSVTTYYDKPAYRVSNESKNSYFTLVPVIINEKNNYKIEATLQEVYPRSEAGYGIMFGAKDEDNGYVFTINQRGATRLIKIEKGKQTVLNEFTCEGIRSDFANPVILECTKGRWDITVEGKDGANCAALPFMGNNIGFYVPSQQHLICYRLAVSEKTPEPKVDPVIEVDAKNLYATLDKVMCHTEGEFKTLIKGPGEEDKKDHTITYISDIIVPGGRNGFFMSSLGGQKQSIGYFSFYPDFTDKNEALALFDKLFDAVKQYRPACFPLMPRDIIYEDQDKKECRGRGIGKQLMRAIQNTKE